MVTKELINSYGFSSLEDYFLYIMESKENGQHKQARELYAQLSDDDGMKSAGQKTFFWDFIETSFFYDAKDSHHNDAEGEQSEFDKLKQYFKLKK